MNDPINVVCLKWGTKYGPEYVNNLYQSVKENLSLPFNFFCFTEDSKGIDPNVIIRPLKYTNIQTWWNKLYLFSDEIDITGRIFFLDLDTLITGNLDKIAQAKGTFIVLRDFFVGLAKGVEEQHHVGSAVMIWEAGKHTYLWTEFIKDPKKAIKELHPHGDQKWIQKLQIDRQYWQDLFPDEIVSFKVHCRDGLPPKAKIVCYHGKPSIPESYSQTSKVQWWTIQPQLWVKKYWRY